MGENVLNGLSHPWPPIGYGPAEASYKIDYSSDIGHRYDVGKYNSCRLRSCQQRARQTHTTNDTDRQTDRHTQTYGQTDAETTSK